MTFRVASIGTTHPWNVAGVGLDIVVGQTFGVEVMTAVAGVSAQDEGGMRALHAIPAAILRAQLETFPVDGLGALRIGALASAQNVGVVAAFVRAHPQIPAVVDPVVGASRGGRLADEPTIAALRDELATLPSVILTPNLAEAALLLGIATIARDDLVARAAALRARGCRAVLLKGGHLEGDPVDVLATADAVELMTGKRVAGTMPGTGCALAMALACELARGLPLREAVESARAFVKGQLVTACKADAPQ
ncbi:MAG TPA: bifunctional hydroxymethylpyrimidine kinase/phosphomethylpyrimidine kinase [Candidatus Baltobacteraceae bacterium]